MSTRCVAVDSRSTQAQQCIIKIPKPYVQLTNTYITFFSVIPSAFLAPLVRASFYLPQFEIINIMGHL